MVVYDDGIIRNPAVFPTAVRFITSEPLWSGGEVGSRCKMNFVGVQLIKIVERQWIWDIADYLAIGFWLGVLELRSNVGGEV